MSHPTTKNTGEYIGYRRIIMDYGMQKQFLDSCQQHIASNILEK